MVQRVLGSHEAVATVSEPWILLPYFYSLRQEGVYAEYNHASAASAVEDFCGTLPGGRLDYIEELRELALRLYEKAAPNGERYFLDKTPRYHLICHEVVDAFPSGKHVFLWRNPLAVISSIIETWGGGRWNVYRHKVDLFDGIERLVAAFNLHGGSAHAVRYEDLLTNPASSWEGIFRYLDLPFDVSMLEGFGGVRLDGGKGDPTGTKKYEGISLEPLEGWRLVLANPLRKAWCRRYLRWLGRERLAVMGYDLDDLLGDLDSLPNSYGGVASDAWRGFYGLAYDLLEPRILRDKLGMMPAWRRVHPHK